MALAAVAGCRVTAIHVDHGQRSGSVEEAAVVERYANELGIALDNDVAFESHSVDVKPGSNLEARMRAARYGVLGADAATGHTADDQAETLLINLVRGAGLMGLGAMQPSHRRPILGLRRTDTEKICSTLGWKPVIDASNDDPAFQRNRMRHEVIPLLNDVADRDIVPLLNRSSQHAREAGKTILEQAQRIDATDAKQLAASPTPVAAIAIQEWIRNETSDVYPVDTASIARVLQVASGEIKAAEVSGGWRVHRSKQRLFVTKA